MNTNELVITDLLNCGYADISMLDILYSPLAEDVGIDSADTLKSAIQQDGDLNSVLYSVYSDITCSVKDRLQEMLNEYNDTLQDGKVTEDTENTDLCDLIGGYMVNDETDEFIGLSEKYLNLIDECIEKLEQSYSFCNFLDSCFQNDLDQTLDEDAGIDQNIKNLLEYILQE